jgi:hypothetical protein
MRFRGRVEALSITKIMKKRYSTIILTCKSQYRTQGKTPQIRLWMGKSKISIKKSKTLSLMRDNSLMVLWRYILCRMKKWDWSFYLTCKKLFFYITLLINVIINYRLDIGNMGYLSREDSRILLYHSLDVRNSFISLIFSI